MTRNYFLEGDSPPPTAESRPSVGFVQLVMETSQAVNQLPYEVDC